MSNDEIIELAEECGATVDCKTLVLYHHETIKFYKTAFNAGLEAAASRTADVATPDAYYIADSIRALEMKL